jgi:hypothetical protein
MSGQSEQSEWEPLARMFLGMASSARISFMNDLADKGVGDEFLKAFFVFHRKLENENHE